MRIYSVGGAVRDRLLGRKAEDRDYVVVGATPEELLAKGFKPVGRDFPVFLHPETRAEYALARTERKSGRGYHGFTFYAAPDVTLEEDLARRDLTINAMAEDEKGRLIDPFGGQLDLQDKILRHVGPAFVEDPVRVLRLARFAARFGDFAVASETAALMREVVASGEVDQLTPERVWQEFSRGLMEPYPEKMLLILHDCGALSRLLPEVDVLFGIPERPEYHPEGDTGAHLLLVMAITAQLHFPLAARFAALVHDLGKGLTPKAHWPHHHGHDELADAPIRSLCARLKVPTELREIGRMTAREHINIHRLAMRVGDGQAEAMTALMERCDVLRRPERFADALLACEADNRGRLGWGWRPYPQGGIWRRTVAAFRGVDAGGIARAAASPAAIPRLLHAARVNAVRVALLPVGQYFIDATEEPT